MILERRTQEKAGGWTPAAFSDASDRITYAICRNPIPWLEELMMAPWAAHDQHTYDGSCAVCKAGDAPFALRAVIDAVLDAIHADPQITAALQVQNHTNDHACCTANMPPLSFTRQPGAEYECPSCGGRWIWDDDEAEGGAWYWDPENDRDD